MFFFNARVNSFFFFFYIMITDKHLNTNDLLKSLNERFVRPISLHILVKSCFMQADKYHLTKTASNQLPRAQRSFEMKLCDLCNETTKAFRVIMC